MDGYISSDSICLKNIFILEIFFLFHYICQEVTVLVCEILHLWNWGGKKGITIALFRKDESTEIRLLVRGQGLLMARSTAEPCSLEFSLVLFEVQQSYINLANF